MLKVYSEIDDVISFWEKECLPRLLEYNFLKIYQNNHPDINHIFIADIKFRLYAHIFSLTFTKTNNYLSKFNLSSFLLNFFSLNVLYLTNSFVTNIPSFINQNKINLNNILDEVKFNFSLIVIPDFLYNELLIKENSYSKIEVEEEMVLDINKDWNFFDDYLNSLKKKYRNKVKTILKKSKSISIKRLSENDLINYQHEIQKLFNQVVESSQFSGPLFNTSSFSSFVSESYMRVDGYFIGNNLVAFSSEIQNGTDLCSYFVGFDKQLNKTYSLYGRILVESIKNSIILKKKRLIFGRTANEYKSNFGAYPIRSFVYLKIKNSFLSFLLTPVLSKLKLNKWRQRKPFKSY